MKSFAVCHAGCFYIANTPTASRAKGLLISYLKRIGQPIQFKTLRCRRWETIETSTDQEEWLIRWGYPNSQDPESGHWISMPEPFGDQPAMKEDKEAFDNSPILLLV